jgi:hypothetical protein
MKIWYLKQTKTFEVEINQIISIYKILILEFTQTSKYIKKVSQKNLNNIWNDMKIAYLLTFGSN